MGTPLRGLTAPAAIGIALAVPAVCGMVVRVFGIRRRERKRLETVINSIDDGIVVLDKNRNVVAANDAFIGRTGTARGDLVGCSCTTVASQMCRGVCDCPTLACVESGEREVRIAQRRRADGSTAWEEIHACRVPGKTEDDVQIVEVWRDISERRAAEARLAESHRLASLGMLASGFSHEMNTPLATVLVCLEGIAREIDRGGPIDPSRIAWHAATAREQLMRCRAITRHFLRMSRGQSGEAQIVDVRQSIGEVVRLVQPTAREYDVTIEVDSPGTEPRSVRADDADLQQALVNLLLNAVQASPRGGTVSLSLIEAEGRVTILVRDSGPGIAADQQLRIFEPFVSLKDGGTGLGLFVSLNSVRKWGGDIHVESAPGAGATFTLTLPAVSVPLSQLVNA